MALDLKTTAITSVQDAKSRFLQDLEALPEEAIGRSPGGAARAPAHFTYEIVCVNARFAKRLRGEDPGPFSQDAWASTPDSFKTKEGALAGFSASMDEILEALKAVPENEMDREIVIPSGTTSPFDLAAFCAMHTNYHDGQLNYIQALNGDAEIHWTD